MDNRRNQDSQPNQPYISYHISSRGQTERTKKKKKTTQMVWVEDTDQMIPLTL